MSFFKKIKHFPSKALRKLGLSRSASNIIGRAAIYDFPGFSRAIQRSHKLGKLGHTIMPSFSNSNYITKAYNKLMSSVGKAAVRNMSRQANTASNLRTQTSMPRFTSQRLNYDYRRLSDIT